jgi:hypothetical protein
MNRIQELIGVLADEAVIARSFNAKRDRTCKICGQSADHFRTPFAELEYSISSICQACQDYFFISSDQPSNRI